MNGPSINPEEWKSKSMKEFSPIHRICSYLAMFPPNLANYFIERFTLKGDLVIDPFCGRGTTPLEAYLLGRDAIGTDLNPLAIRLSDGKVKAPVGKEGILAVLSRVQELEDKFKLDKSNYSNEAKRIKNDQERNESVGVVFSKSILQQLLFLRMELITKKPNEKVDSFLISIILGAMHGSTNSYFSVPMPNTFSMSPNYIKSYVKEKGLVYPNVNVFAIIRERSFVALFSAAEEGTNSVEIREWNAKRIGEFPAKKQAKLLFSSPPYLKVIKYGQYNWIRLWFLGISHKEVDRKLSDNLDLKEYLDFMDSVISSSVEVMDPNGLSCWVIGDVQKGNITINLAEKVWERIKDSGKWELHCVEDAPNGIIVDEIAPSKKVTRIWNSGGHEIWHKEQDRGVDECIHVATQSEAESKLKELGKEYVSVPIGTSGQATLLDRILMIKPRGAKVRDNRILTPYKKGASLPKSSPPNHLYVSTPYLEWLVGYDNEEYHRFIRRLNKMELIRVIFEKLGPNLDPNHSSSGSTVKRLALEIIWERIPKLENDCQIPRTKHKILHDIYRHLGLGIPDSDDVSSSSTITRVGIFKIFVGLMKPKEENSLED